MCVGITLALQATYLITTDPVRSSDETAYRLLAQNLTSSGTLGFTPDQPSAFLPPLYPLFLALLQGPEESDFERALAVQLVIGGLCTLLIVRLGLRLGGPAAAWASGIFAFSFVPAMKAPAHFLTEPLASLLLLFSLLWADCSLQRDRLRAMAMSGGSYALAALTRAVTFPLVLVSAGFLFLRSRDWRLHALRAGVLLAVFALIYSPWVIRNRIHLDQWLLLTEQGSTVRRVAFQTAELIDDGVSFDEARRIVLKGEDPLPAMPAEIPWRVSLRHVGQRLLIMLGWHSGLDRPWLLPGHRVYAPPLLRTFHHVWIFLLQCGVVLALAQVLRRRALRLLHVVAVPGALLAVHALVHALPRYQFVPFLVWSVAAGVGWAGFLAGVSRRLSGSDHLKRSSQADYGGARNPPARSSSA